MDLFQSEWDSFITDIASGVAESLYSAGMSGGVQRRLGEVDVAPANEGELE